jgi:hypothetical protein
MCILCFLSSFLCKLSLVSVSVSLTKKKKTGRLLLFFSETLSAHFVNNFSLNCGFSLLAGSWCQEELLLRRRFFFSWSPASLTMTEVLCSFSPLSVCFDCVFFPLDSLYTCSEWTRRERGRVRKREMCGVKFLLLDFFGVIILIACFVLSLTPGKFCDQA